MITADEQFEPLGQRLVTYLFHGSRNGVIFEANTKNVMKRLPGYDLKTSRAELAAFSSLGLIGVSLIIAGVSNGLKFAERRSEIIATLSGSRSADQINAGGNRNHEVTNLVEVQKAAPLQGRLIRAAAPTCGSRGQAL